MRERIGNVICDTEKAKAIASKTFMEGTPCEYTETLFRMRSYQLFLHGTGKDESRYSRINGDGKCETFESVTLLTTEGAMEWMRRADVYVRPAEYQLPEDVYLAVTISEEDVAFLNEIAGDVGKGIEFLSSNFFGFISPDEDASSSEMKRVRAHVNRLTAECLRSRYPRRSISVIVRGLIEQARNSGVQQRSSSKRNASRYDAEALEQINWSEATHPYPQDLYFHSHP